MSYDKVTNSEQTALQRLRKRIIYSEGLGFLANLPILKGLLKNWTTRRLGKHLVQTGAVERPASSGLEATLKNIVNDAVHALGYVVALIGIYEQDDSVSIRALYIDAGAATLEQIWEWEKQISQFTYQRFSFSNPDDMRVFIYDDTYKRNLGVWAARQGKPFIHEELFTIFRTMVPNRAKPIIDSIQQSLAIETVIAVPLFLENQINDQTTRDTVGILFAAKSDTVTPGDVRTLSAFGRQIAAAIESEKRRRQIEVMQKLVFAMQTSLQNEDQILQRIVKSVVFELGYIGAMVATYEEIDESLPVRAVFVDPKLASEEQIHEWEKEVSAFALEPISLSDPDVAKVYIHEEAYKDNLSVQAAEAGQPVCSESLFDLFTPVAPAASKPIAEGIQAALGIRSVVAVPFFLTTLVNGQSTTEFVGNLFAATSSRVLRKSDFDLLRVFGQQAAAGIRNARLYRKSEESREKAQRYSRMAYSAAASVHALRNHIGAFKMYLQLSQAPVDEELNNLNIAERLETADKILRHLHDPWHESSDTPANIYIALKRAIGMLSSRWKYDDETLKVSENVIIQIDTQFLQPGLPQVAASQRMLSAALKVLLRHTWKSAKQKPSGGNIWVECENVDQAKGIVEIIIRDNGIGLKPHELQKLFETSKASLKEITIGVGSLWVADYIEGIGGELKTQSRWQEGITFRLTLPIMPDIVI